MAHEVFQFVSCRRRADDGEEERFSLVAFNNPGFVALSPEDLGKAVDGIGAPLRVKEVNLKPCG